MQSYCPSLMMDEKCAIKELGKAKTGAELITTKNS